ncbi:MAG TPA: phage tail tape measure protein [Streptosporangiaceae bacterium]
MGFNSAMEMLVTQAGVSNAKLGVLKQGVLGLAAQVGFSPDSLAQSLYHVASNFESMGASAAKELAVVKMAAEGAKVGGADLVDVTNALTAAVASGIPGVQNYSQAMGALNAIVGAGDMKMQDLAEAFGSGMVATVKGFGLSLTDVGAALATFGDNNIRGAHAGTQLRMSVMALAAPTAAGTKLLGQMGIGATQLAVTMQHGGLLPALQMLIGHMRAAGITAKQQGLYITEMFGKRAGAGLNVLLDQMDRLKSKYPAITKGAHDFGTAWGDTQKQLKQQLAELDSGFKALMVTIGEKIIPPLQAFVGLLLRHKTATVAVVAAVGALAAGLAIAALAIKTVEIATKTWAAVQWLLNVALDANPIGLVIAAVAALVIGVIYAYNHFRIFRVVVADVGRMFEAVFGWLKAHWPLVLAILTGPVGLAVLFIKSHWQEIVAGAQQLWHDVVSWFTRIGNDIVRLTLGWPKMLWQAGVNMIMGLVHGIESAAMAPVHAVENIVSDIRNFLPFSPARRGPLSGAGSPDVAGRRIGQMLAAGMLSTTAGVAAAAGQVAGAAGIRGAAGGAGAGGGPQIVIEVHGSGSGLDNLFFDWFQRGVRVRGGSAEIVNRKVRFA